jgi:hypothetical protein
LNLPKSVTFQLDINISCYIEELIETFRAERALFSENNKKISPMQKLIIADTEKYLWKTSQDTLITKRSENASIEPK